MGEMLYIFFTKVDKSHSAVVLLFMDETQVCTSNCKYDCGNFSRATIKISKHIAQKI